MKALFVTHDTGLYGASRSLQLLLNNLTGIEIDLVINKRIRGANDHARIREKFGSRIRNIYECYLPFSRCCEGGPSNAFFCGLKNILWQLTKRRFYVIVENNQYDFIHLNSLVLHPMIKSRYPFIIHVREILNVGRDKVSETLSKARAVIFIDEATKKPFKDRLLAKTIVLNNPFDMSGLRKYLGSQKLPGKNAIFSVIGKIIECKGVDFIIKSFMRMSNETARLLIVGEGERGYVKQCRKIAQNDSRIIFSGAEQDILRIYAMSDYIIRGEAYPCVGRTIYEGLYAGCDVVIPGEQKDKGMFFEYNRFQDKIHFYPPRDIKKMTALLQWLANRKITYKTFHSNVTGYQQEFLRFVAEAIGQET